MPGFYDFQNDHIKKMITATFKETTDLGSANAPETTLFHEFRRIYSNHNEHKASVK